MASGAIVVEAARKNLPTLPVDGEHSAIFQVLAGAARSGAP